jgi:hypothetical protein
VFIGRDAAFKGVIANAVRAGFPPCHPSCPPVPLGSRDREVRCRLQVVRHTWGWC